MTAMHAVHHVFAGGIPQGILGAAIVSTVVLTALAGVKRLLGGGR